MVCRIELQPDPDGPVQFGIAPPNVKIETAVARFRRADWMGVPANQAKRRHSRSWLRYFAAIGVAQALVDARVGAQFV